MHSNVFEVGLELIRHQAAALGICLCTEISYICSLLRGLHLLIKVAKLFALLPILLLS